MKKNNQTALSDPLTRESISTTFELESQQIVSSTRSLSRLLPSKGGTSMAIITLVATCLGTGMLTLPAIAKKSGLSITLLFLTFCAIISYNSMQLISLCAYKCSATSYPNLVHKVLGQKIGKIFEILMVLYQFAACVSIQIVFQILSISILQDLNLIGDEKQARIWIQIIYILPNLLVSLQKSLYSLRYFTFMGVAFVLYVVLAMVIEFMRTLIITDFKHVTLKGVMTFHLDEQIFITLSTSFYCYMCHQFVLPIRNELKKPTLKRQGKINLRASLFIYFTLCVVTITGYLTFQRRIESLVINNYTSLPFLVGKFALVVPTFFGVPLNLLACREIIQTMISQERSENSHILITVILQVLSAFVALMFPQITQTLIFYEISKAISFMGGFFGTILVCVFPAVIFIKQSSRLTCEDILLMVGMCLTTLAGWTGAIFSLL